MVNQRAGLFHGARLRLVIAFIVFVAIILIAFFTWRYALKKHYFAGGAKVTGAPSIEAIPGKAEVSEEYLKKQSIESARLAEEARKKAQSAVPTISRPGFIGSPEEFAQLPKTTARGEQTPSPACPINKLVVMYKPNPEACTPDSLRKARQAGVAPEELRCLGCSCPSLKAVGYTAGELKTTGLDAKALSQCGFTLSQLRQAGFSAADLKAAGFSDQDLAKAGFSPAEIRAAGMISATNCNVEALRQAKAEGVSAAELRKKGCGAAALKAAGYTDKELKDAGFSDADIRAANQAAQQCDVESLKKARAAGVTARELRNRGCGLAALKAAGFTAAELKDAGFTAKELKDAGFSAADLKAAGFSAGQLKDAGFSAADLKNAGFTAQDLRNAGYSPADLKEAGFTPADLQLAGFSKGDLLRAGFTPTESGYAAEKPVVGTVPTAVTAAGAIPGGAVVPTVAGAVSVIPTVQAETPEQKLARLEKDQQERLSRQQRQDIVNQQQSGMAVEAQKLLTGWSNYPTQAYKEGVKEVLKTTTTTTTAAAGGVAAAAVAVPGVPGAAAGGTIVKAGTVLFGVIDTSINTDEKTPILATVVSGNLKGSRLLGKFDRTDTKVYIQFNLVSIPSIEKTLPFNGVAIDPDTARTALSGDIDYHYMLIYGSLFASAFLEGLSQAIMTSGSTTTDTILGPVTTHSPFSVVEDILVGLGTVGEKYAATFSKNFNLPPTITIPGGTGIGILVMSDLILPIVIPAPTTLVVPQPTITVTPGPSYVLPPTVSTSTTSTSTVVGMPSI